MNSRKGRMRALMAGLLTASVMVAPAAAPAGAEGRGGPQATAARYCGKADIGFTSAKVRARKIACSKARRFVRRNSRRKLNCNEANGFCRVTRYKGFRCVKSGGGIVKVSCKRGSQVISETHGD